MGNNESNSPTGAEAKYIKYMGQKHPDSVKYLEKLIKKYKIEPTLKVDTWKMLVALFQEQIALSKGKKKAIFRRTTQYCKNLAD